MGGWLSVQPEVCLAVVNLRLRLSRESVKARDVVSRARYAGGIQGSVVGRAHLALVAWCKWCKWRVVVGGASSGRTRWCKWEGPKQQQQQQRAPWREQRAVQCVQVNP